MAKRKISQRERKGRDLEELVARLEGGVRPEGVTITSPDWLTDEDTGDLREVDVSVRISSERGDRLIVLECRDRRARQDVRWFEELATKKQSVRADQLIAVSTSPFTSGALKKAARHGILAHRMEQVGIDSLAEWLSVSGLFFAHRSEVVSGAFGLAFGERPEAEQELLRADLRKLGTDELGDDLIFDPRSSTRCSVVEFWNSVLSQDREQRLFSNVPPNGRRIRINLKLEFPDRSDRLKLRLPSGDIDLSSMRIGVDLWKEKTVIDPIRTHTYRSEAAQLVRSAEYTIGNMKLAFIRDEGTGALSFTSDGIPDGQYSGSFEVQDLGLSGPSDAARLTFELRAHQPPGKGPLIATALDPAQGE